VIRAPSKNRADRVRSTLAPGGRTVPEGSCRQSFARSRRRHLSSGGSATPISDLAEPAHDDVPNLDRVERLPDASHWVHHDEAEQVNRLLVEFFASQA
jgi:pimeloyl-ACP methyl ester carboxylesterase